MSSVSVEDCAQVIISHFGVSRAEVGSPQVWRELIRGRARGTKYGDYCWTLSSRDQMLVRDFQVAKHLVRLLKRTGLKVEAKLDPKGVSRIPLFTPRSSVPEGAPEGTIYINDIHEWEQALKSIVIGSVWAHDLGGELLSLSAAFARLENAQIDNRDAISRKLRSLAKELKAVTD